MKTLRLFPKPNEEYRILCVEKIEYFVIYAALRRDLVDMEKAYAKNPDSKSFLKEQIEAVKGILEEYKNDPEIKA